MGARILGLSALSSLALVVVPAILGCDTPSKSTIDELKASVDKLTAQMAKNEAASATKEELAALRTDLKEALADWDKTELTKLRADLASKASRSEIDEVAEKFDRAMKATRDRQTELRRTVEQIAKTDTTQSRVQATHKPVDPGDSSGDDVLRTVRKSVTADPQRGTLHVENAMPGNVLLRVNGLDYWVAGGAVTDFVVPVGTVTTELVNFEPAQTRTIGAPDFSTTMTIRPKTVSSPY